LTKAADMSLMLMLYSCSWTLKV